MIDGGVTAVDRAIRGISLRLARPHLRDERA